MLSGIPEEEILETSPRIGLAILKKVLPEI